MNAEILCIGTELLHGDIANTNGQYISKRLAEIGIDVHYHSVVGDNPIRMEKALKLAFSRADIVICTGGLGPTKDDITKDIAAKYFNLTMEFDEGSLQHVKNLYKRLGREMSENNLRQTYFPKGSKILPNKNGTANACIINIDKKIGILLPGPPREMQPLMKEEVIPYLMQFSKDVVVGKKIVVIGVGESKAETMIMDLIDNQSNPTIAPYAGKGKVVFRVTAKAESKNEALKLIKPIEDEMFKRFGKNAFLLDDSDIEETVSKMLLNKNLTIATAESCTGGLVASKLISYPGISKVFKEGFVTYSNEAKINTLGVKKETIDKYGAVSRQTAEEMAKRAAEKSGADIGVSTTGIAGPGGGTKEKPVGLVYICAYINGDVHVRKLNYPGHRNIIRERAAISVLDLVRRLVN